MQVYKKTVPMIMPSHRPKVSKPAVLAEWRSDHFEGYQYRGETSLDQSGEDIGATA
ncbi:MAG: hypothetical protein ACOCY3_00015 [Desulfosalsimonas sp.]